MIRIAKSVQPVIFVILSSLWAFLIVMAIARTSKRTYYFYFGDRYLPHTSVGVMAMQKVDRYPTLSTGQDFPICDSG